MHTSRHSHCQWTVFTTCRLQHISVMFFYYKSEYNRCVEYTSKRFMCVGRCCSESVFLRARNLRSGGLGTCVPASSEPVFLRARCLCFCGLGTCVPAGSEPMFLRARSLCPCGLGTCFPAGSGLVFLRARTSCSCGLGIRVPAGSVCVFLATEIMRFVQAHHSCRSRPLNCIRRQCSGVVGSTTAHAAHDW